MTQVDVSTEVFTHIKSTVAKRTGLAVEFLNLTYMVHFLASDKHFIDIITLLQIQQKRLLLRNMPATVIILQKDTLLVAWENSLPYDPLRILLEESEHSQQNIGKWKPAAFRSYYPYHTTINYLWISDR